MCACTLCLTLHSPQHLFDASNYKLTRSKSGESRLFLHYGDLADTSNLVDVIRRVQPDEIYNLAAQSHVQVTTLLLNNRHARRCIATMVLLGSTHLHMKRRPESS